MDNISNTSIRKGPIELRIASPYTLNHGGYFGVEPPSNLGPRLLGERIRQRVVEVTVCGEFTYKLPLLGYESLFEGSHRSNLLPAGSPKLSVFTQAELVREVEEFISYEVKDICTGEVGLEFAPRATGRL